MSLELITNGLKRLVVADSGGIHLKTGLRYGLLRLLRALAGDFLRIAFLPDQQVGGRRGGNQDSELRHRILPSKGKHLLPELRAARGLMRDD